MKRKILPALGLCLLSIFFIVSFLYADGSTAVGRVAKMTGSATLIRSDERSDLREGGEVFRRDRIESGKGMTSIVFVDGSIIRLSGESIFSIDEYDIGPGKAAVTLKLLSGKLRANVNRLIDGDSRYEIRTPTAVAGVRGTDLVVDFDMAAGETRVAFLEGFGEVALDGIRQKLKANEQIVLGRREIVRKIEKIGEEFRLRHREILENFGARELELRERFKTIHGQIEKDVKKAHKDLHGKIKKNQETLREKADEANGKIHEVAREIGDEKLPKVRKTIKEKVEKIRNGK